MACPDCGSSIGEFRIASSVETHGLDCGPYERFEQEYVVCQECGERCDIRNWERSPELSTDPPDLLREIRSTSAEGGTGILSHQLNGDKQPTTTTTSAATTTTSSSSSSLCHKQ